MQPGDAAAITLHSRPSKNIKFCAHDQTINKLVRTGRQMLHEIGRAPEELAANQMPPKSS